jgi:hypothetical protein
MTEPAAPTITSPRLRGEVGSCAGRGSSRRQLNMRRSCQTPHPDPLPASGAREPRAVTMHQSVVRIFANLCNGVLIDMQHGFSGKAAVEQLACDGRNLTPRCLDRDIGAQRAAGDEPGEQPQSFGGRLDPAQFMEQ